MCRRSINLAAKERIPVKNSAAQKNTSNNPLPVNNKTPPCQPSKVTERGFIAFESERFAILVHVETTLLRTSTRTLLTATLRSRTILVTAATNNRLNPTTRQSDVVR